MIGCLAIACRRRTADSHSQLKYHKIMSLNDSSEEIAVAIGHTPNTPESQRNAQLEMD